MRLIKSTLAIFIVASITACSNNPKREHLITVKESFNTSITQNGSKFFTYELTQSKPKDQKSSRRPPNGTSGDPTNGAPPGGGNKTPKRDKGNGKIMTLTQLESKLKQTGFCHKGYVLLEKKIERSNAKLRGECRESATPKDRKKIFEQIIEN
jgi:hypothetical protein